MARQYQQLCKESGPPTRWAPSSVCMGSTDQRPHFLRSDERTGVAQRLQKCSSHLDALGREETLGQDRHCQLVNDFDKTLFSGGPHSDATCGDCADPNVSSAQTGTKTMARLAQELNELEELEARDTGDHVGWSPTTRRTNTLSSEWAFRPTPPRSGFGCYSILIFEDLHEPTVTEGTSNMPSASMILYIQQFVSFFLSMCIVIPTKSHCFTSLF